MEITKKQILNRGINNSQVIEEQNKKTGGKKLVEMVSELFHSETQVHMFHLQTKSQSSFAEHSALGGYYTEIGENLDGLIESYQGKYDIVKGYKSYPFEDYKNVEQLIKYFNDLADMITSKRDCCKDSYIQNQIDEIETLIYSTLYKLRNLK
jgi:DNA-binding ferritin-like protein